MILLLPSSYESLGKYAPIASLFSASLSARFGLPVEVRSSKSYDTMVSDILEQRVHMAWAPPRVCAQVEDDVRCILKSIRQGRSSYQAALIVRAGEMTSKEALRGMRAAWVDPLSSGGYLLATSYLTSIDMAPDGLFGEQKFMGSYNAVLQAVAQGEADVASIYVNGSSREHARERLIELIGRDADQLDVLMFTRATPNDGMIITRAMNEDEAVGIAETLISEPPVSLIKALEVEGFVRAMPADYRMLR
jgi:ABC-type phosphate/phosphonate transport system substrate-binding protein